MYLSAKQIELISICAKLNEDGSVPDLDQIIERASWHPSKQSIHFSIRALVNKGLIEKLAREKRRGRVRTIIGATDLGKHFVGAGTKPLALELIEDELTESLLEV